MTAAIPSLLPTLILALEICLIVGSVGGYLALAKRLRERGGHVDPSRLTPADSFVTFMLCSLLATVLVVAFLGGPRPPEKVNLGEMFLNTGVFLVPSLSIIGFLGVRGIPLRTVFGHWLTWRRLLLALGLLLLAVPAVLAAAALLVTVLPQYAHDEQTLVTFFREEARKHHYQSIIAIFFAAAILAPLVEEFLFRGYFYPTLKRTFGATSSAIFTSALFAVCHMHAATLPGLFLLALAFVVAYEITGSLFVPMAMHAMFNGFSLLLLYLQAQELL